MSINVTLDALLRRGAVRATVPSNMTGPVNDVVTLCVGVAVDVVDGELVADGVCVCVIDGVIVTLKLCERLGVVVPLAVAS